MHEASDVRCILFDRLAKVEPTTTLVDVRILLFDCISHGILEIGDKRVSLKRANVFVNVVKNVCVAYLLLTRH